ncbi:MFS transporter [Chryseobacterium sp. 1B4]
MTLSVLLMSFGSLLIALTPTYECIGILAPLLLLLARLLQGLSVGGEYGVSATYLSEMSTQDRRGFYSSFQYVTLIGGQLIALGIQLILQKLLLTEIQLEEWGWRIPFVIGAMLSIIALYLRANLHETEAFENKKDVSEKKKGTVKELLKHPKALLTVVGLTLGGTLAFYTYTTYMQKFLVNTVHLTKEQSTLVSFISLFIFACLQPVFGGLSDKIGRRPLLLGFGILGTLCTVPLLTALSTTTSIWTAFFLIMAALIIVSGYTSINAVVKAELFPSEIRALGVGLPYAITVAVFGGTAEYIALWFKKIGSEEYFYWYITGCILFSLVVYIGMKDTKKTLPWIKIKVQNFIKNCAADSCGAISILMIGLFKFFNHTVQIMTLDIYAFHLLIPWRFVENLVEIHTSVSHLYYFLYFDIQLSQFVFEDFKFILDTTAH